MKKYLYVGTGGFIGAVLRYWIENRTISLAGIPLNTLFINIGGSFLLALFLTFAFDFFEMNPHLRLGIATGLFGAFTTFATFTKEAFMLIEQQNVTEMIIYTILSLFLGLIAAYLGIVSGRELIKKLLHEKWD